MDSVRRQFLAFVAAAGGWSLSGCFGPPTGGLDLPTPSPQFGLAMVDGHCHTFNAKDLSPTRFIRYAHMELYPGPNESVPVSGVEGKDLLDGAIETVLALVGAGVAPSVDDEIAYLDGRSGGDPAAVLESARVEEATDNLAGFLSQRPAVRPDDPDAGYRERGEALVYYGVIAAVGESVPVSGGLDAVERRSIARRFISGDFDQSVPVSGRELDLWQLFKWVGLFRRYRHVLVDDLVTRHRGAGWNPVLIAPAMVDFGRFIREEPVSTLQEQVRVWSRIARRPGGPAIHGYVAYCPLRQALWKHSVEARLREGPEPLGIVANALETGGFLGVKLYPPMGFQAVGNVDRDFGRYPFSDDVLCSRFGNLPVPELRAKSRELAQEIDEALDGLYGLCERLDAPLMAHGGPGNAVKRYYGELSDPWLWRPLFEAPRSRPLRVMLAHYGSFEDSSVDPAGLVTPWPEPSAPIPIPRTKEAALARFLKAKPQAPVFVDMSMFTEVIALDGPTRERMLTAFRDFMADVGEDHMIFGTDWTMLGLQKGEQDYDAAIADFCKQAGLEDVQMTKVLRTNFVRFAGLERGSATRERLDNFNATYGQRDRLAVLDT